MSYLYSEMKHHLFTDEGQCLFLRIRDNAFRLTADAGCARMTEIIRGCGGDSWKMLACVDRMVELGELREVEQDDPAGQDRIFVRSGR